jgi:pyruvate dehydrogenase E2 component (dihydrolipoamide acetyltransferase)
MLPKSETTAKLEVEAAPASCPKVLFQQKFYRRNKNSQMRKIIAKRLAESLIHSTSLQPNIEVTMDDAMQARTTINNFLIKKFHLMTWLSKHVLYFEKHPKLTLSGKKKQSPLITT